LDGFKVQPDIISWDIQTFFIVYQTFALSQIVKLTIVTLTSLSCKIKIINIMFQCFFLLPTCFDHQKTGSVNNYQLFNWENKQYHSI
jgi:hypothetical protein